MNKVEIKKTMSDINIDINKVLIAVLSCLTLVVFINTSYSIYFGPVMAAIISYLYFNGYASWMMALILVANDALGTIIGGSISFPYLLFVLVGIDIIKKGKFSRSFIPVLLVALYFIFQLYWVEYLSFRQVIYSITFILSLLSLPRDSSNMIGFFRGVILAVALISLHACITGGIEYYELDEYSQEVLRKGVLGVGIGDSNYSCFLIAIGLICVWCEKNLHLAAKIALTAIMLYAILITLSISGLLAIGLLLFVGTFFSQNKKRDFALLLVIVILALVAFTTYVQLPNDARNETLDGYIGRIEDKYDALLKGDYSEVTTKRSDLFVNYVKYIFIQQPLGSLLLGGNSLNIIDGMVPHNTYIGVFLQIGIIGAIAFFTKVIQRFYDACREKEDSVYRKRIILLKVLCLFMATNLSFYEGSLWSMWFYFLIVL